MKHYASRSRPLAQLHRWYLHIRAKLLGVFSSHARAEWAWNEIVSLEMKTLRLRDPSRAHAMVELARCFAAREVPLLTGADALLRQVHNLVCGNSDYDFIASRALCLRGSIKFMQRDLTAAIDFHERAERLYLHNRLLCSDRADNLERLAKCYTQVGRLTDAADTRQKSASLRLILAYAAPRLYP